LSFVLSSTVAGLFKTSGKFDIIIATSPPLFIGITAYLLSIIKRVPFVFEVRDLWPESAIDAGVLTNKAIIRVAYWFEQFIYKKALKVNVLTPAFRTALINGKNVPKEKILYIPNAADFGLSERILLTFDRSAFRASQGFADKKVIIYVGAHGVANDLIQVIDVATLLKDREEILFLLVGEGMQKKSLQHETVVRELTNIRFVDSVSKEKVFDYILAADFGLSILKKAETFKTIYSNKTFDYMACKRPVLMVIDGISRELVETAGCGVYIEPGDPQAFAKAVKNYCYQPEEELRNDGEAGYRYVQNHFDRKVLGLKYLEEVRSAVSSKVEL
jgi:glycosyltransferase involved in cell wall biosynthesis